MKSQLLAFVALTASLAACGTKSSSSAVDAAATLPMVARCSLAGTTADTVFTVSTAQSGIVRNAVGKLTVSGRMAHFIELTGFNCENDLAQPAIVGGPVYRWACNQTQPAGSTRVSIFTVQGNTTAEIIGSNGSITNLSCN